MPPGIAGPVLVAGVGSIGRRHLRNLMTLGLEEFILYRTGKGPPRGPEADRRPEPEWLDEFPTVTSLDAALERRPAAAVVSNPTSLHVETAVAAARAGAHLLVEKPLSNSLERVGELRREVQKRQLVLLVGYQFRFHPTLISLRELVREGLLGRPLSARAWWGEYLPGWHPGEDYTRSYAARRDLGGGAVLTLSHPLDYLCWILGSVKSVSCYADHVSDLDIQVEDVAEITLRFESGTMGHLHLDYLRQPPDHGLEIVGTRGAVTWAGGHGIARRFDAEAGEWIREEPPRNFQRNDLFLEEARHFLACVAGEEEPRCTIDDGERALRVALAALRSARSGTMVSV